jgi:hypothetical protein
MKKVISEICCICPQMNQMVRTHIKIYLENTKREKERERERERER